MGKFFVEGPFTNDFVDWLDSKSEYGSKMFINDTLLYSQYNTFGGKKSFNEVITKVPIIFFHGNSDGALKIGDNEFNSGWSEVISTLVKYGYKSSSMYAYTYGDRNIKLAPYRQMDCDLVTQANKFITAVLQYTGSKKIDIVGHSMGVSIARKAILGGKIKSDNIDCPTLPLLSDKIRNFISISGAHYGMCICSKDISSFVKSCSMENGFYSGTRCSTALDKYSPCNSFRHIEGECTTEDYSEFLKDINNKKIKEGENILSIWSDDDEVLGYKNLVWGRKTSLHPFSDEEIIFFNKTHHQTKNDSGFYIYQYINKNMVNFYK
ncbi:Lipase EstA/Esterase EstB family-containing protein [Strongyloides ratti]|uniref:Lipase EstA/Esterase EstB family-containing protein n=1 Tax=Strongyloides ratti TaxID=34506 RepID=A0A090KXE7_STRRB|nr:Lipase EstA/Esterase EstB family-containing protein [Strongyloides ratti]CEF62091.1 Lipase EstA/Esterase EstB family-containing protein [Strongyloides ratti]